jgi:hypothetical protein
MADPWIPSVEIETEKEVIDGVWHQKFTLTDGPHSGSRRYPVDRVGGKIDLTDPQALLSIWKTLRESGDGGDGH